MYTHIALSTAVPRMRHCMHVVFRPTLATHSLA